MENKDNRETNEMMNTLKNDLENLQVPEIPEGKIADAVMKKVSQNKKIAFPKFRIANFAGTACALVIIAALVIANPNVFDTIPKDNKADAVNEITDDAVFLKNLATGSENGKDLVSDAAESDGSVTFDANYTAYVDEFAEKPDGTQNSVMLENVESQNPVVNDVSGKALKASRAPEDNISDSYKKEKQTSRYESEMIFEEANAVETQNDEEKSVSLFEGVVFEQHENALEKNINTANAKVKEISAYTENLSYELIKKAGISNEKFLQWLNSIAQASEYNFESLYVFAKS